MEDATVNRLDSIRWGQTGTAPVTRIFTRNLENLPLSPATDHRRSRSTPKVTDHPWLTINTPYSEFNTSIEAKSTTFNNSNNSLFNKDTSNIDTNTLGYKSIGSKYDWKKHSLMLCKHILERGLLEGIGSDVKIFIPTWNKTYNLHRLILDQNPYFKLLLQGQFQESVSNQVTLHFDDNPYITIESFQFVLEYLYGKIDDPFITQANVQQILATSSYFQLDVCGICIDFILKNLNHQNVINYLIFTNELMVQGSDRICDAIFTFLCREAYDMNRKVLVSLPLDWLQKIVESDAFWVPSEYKRYHFIKQVIQARHEAYIASPSSFILSELDTDPNCPILSQSIHYMHMTFEQLESIQNDIHPHTKKRLVSETILKEALWLQVKLRSKIESASESDSKLNLTISTTSNQQQSSSETTVTAENTESKENEEEEYDNCNEENEEKVVDKKELLEKYYLIPTDDTTTYTGDSTVPSTKKKTSRHNSLLQEYSIYPPFRFSVEFADVSALKYSMRVYSDTVFYAGSNWNMYIQKTRSQRKGILQLGVYLHRQSVPQPHHCQHTDNSQQHASDTKIKTSNEVWSFSRYTDKRKIVKSWFKIYCPSRGPKHALTLFQSSPDNFSVLQSWGWRSTTLCADEDANVATSSTDSTAPETPSSPTPYTPQTSNQLHYLQSTYDLRTIKSALNNVQQENNLSGTSLKFTVVMGHV